MCYEECSISGLSNLNCQKPTDLLSPNIEVKQIEEFFANNLCFSFPKMTEF